MRDRIKSLLDRLGVSQAEFVREVGLSKNQIGEILSGRAQSISTITAAKIHERYGVSLNWLLLGEGEMFVGEPPMPADATPEERNILRLLRDMPELRPIVLKFLRGSATLKETIAALESLPPAKQQTALRLIQALE